MSSMLLNSL